MPIPISKSQCKVEIEFPDRNIEFPVLLTTFGGTNPGDQLTHVSLNGHKGAKESVERLVVLWWECAFRRDYEKMPAEERPYVMRTLVLGHVMLSHPQRYSALLDKKISGKTVIQHQKQEARAARENPEIRPLRFDNISTIIQYCRGP